MATIYLDIDGRTQVVATNGLDPKMFGSFRIKMGSKSRHRIKSPEMPMVSDFLTAQTNLDRWAKKKGLREFRDSEVPELALMEKR